MPKPYYARYGKLILLCFAVLLPIVLYTALRASQRNENDVRTWLPDDYEETRDYAWFKSRFGLEEFILVMWPGCTLDSPELEAFAERLLPEEGEPDADKRRAFFARVVTGSRLVDELTQPDDELEEEGAALTREEAIDRLKGTLIGPDGEQTCAVVTPTDVGKEQLHEMLNTIKEAAVEAGAPAEEIRMGGPPVINAAIDMEGARSLSRLAGLSGLVALVVSWWCFRSLKVTALVFSTGLFCAALSLSVLWFSDTPMNAILLMMPPLVYVAVMSGAIHLVNYYLEALREAGPERAPHSAVSHAWLPLTLAASTTGIGLLSLCYSELLPIQQFGIFSACGVVLGTVSLLLFLPSALQVWPVRSTEVPELDHETHDDGLLVLSRRWEMFAQSVIRHKRWVALGGLSALIALGAGLQWLQTSIKVERFFAPSSRVMQDYVWIQEKLGPLVPMEVVIRVPEAAELKTVDQMQLVARAQDRIRELEEVGSTMSAVTFVPLLETSSIVRRAALNRKLTRALDDLVETNYLHQGEGENLWRISLRIPSLLDVDFNEFNRKIRETVEPVLDEERSLGATGLSAVYTGMVPVFNKAQRSLLDGLIFGFTTDLALIVIAVIFLMRHWSAGFIIMLTSMFPVSVVFGFMSWRGIPVDVGSVMTPSVALGVTVDDVVHFLLWFRRGILRGMDRNQAVMLAYEGCAKPMYQSWGVIGLGLSVFALSTFVPAFRFGALMIALLTAGLAGNLLLLPSLLAGPLGGIFARHVLRTNKAAVAIERETTAPVKTALGSLD